MALGAVNEKECTGHVEHLTENLSFYTVMVLNFDIFFIVLLWHVSCLLFCFLLRKNNVRERKCSFVTGNLQ